MATIPNATMNRYVAEAVGTFVLVFTGIGTAVLAGDRVGAIGVAAAFGLALLAMVYAVGPISGCHLNPVVTLGLVLAGKFERRQAPGYIAAQIVGAIVAAGMVLVVAKGAPGGYDAAAAGLGSNGFEAHSPGGYRWWAVFIAETLLTAVLVLTILGATDLKAPVGFAGVAIGLALTLVHLVAIPISNASINPARSIGPAVFAGGWALSQLWLFVLAPLVGACVAAAVYRLIKTEEEPILRETRAVRATPRQQAERREAISNLARTSGDAFPSEVLPDAERTNNPDSRPGPSSRASDGQTAGKGESPPLH